MLIYMLCRLFEDRLDVEKNATNYDGEVTTVYASTTQLLAAGLSPAKVAFFIDSQGAISDLSSNTRIDCLNTIQCRNKIAELILFYWTVALQWVPSYVGIPAMNQPTKKPSGEQSSQPEVPLTLRRAISIISTFIDKCNSRPKIQAPWKAIGNPGHGGSYSEAPEENRGFCPLSFNDWT
ncbi:reverse transcriptase [Trichonephila clavipes]|nr:reverse transcriptase [Trichonephila clavipes]